MAFVVVGWHTGVALKYVAILVAASITTLVVYEILVRRVSAVRFLFGMKRRMKSHSPPRDPSRGRGTVSEA